MTKHFKTRMFKWIACGTALMTLTACGGSAGGFF
ncbi:hypothetical protein PEL8287_00096 [Roseovarius litorisediminis]|uniref:Lipoprotein n=1 Tax=Roseovarius litorisediminis TaxID=1312363 RepID=A0A1Y5R707_9RHOB|nr:hypothetical protein PEL8287_00096 [Roseovarius litorisediminis]